MLEAPLSMLSSLKDDFPPDEDFVQPHYKEAYRLAIDALVSGGHDAYRDALKAEQIGDFLAEAERALIVRGTENGKPPSSSQGRHSGEVEGSPADSPTASASSSSSGTYWPTHSDVETPNLELGWPSVMHGGTQTHVELLFHPPRMDSPTIKESMRKHIQEAHEVIAVAMDVFTDVDLFREIVDASIRGVSVYVLLDHSHYRSFLTMAEGQDIQVCKLRNMRVRTVKGQNYMCRTGAKFHGSMEQRFLLVDCRTVFFGSYSFMWSYEKINLSMVQVITGHLVASYDEEFRTLYARSIVPPELAPLEAPPGDSSRGMASKLESFERKHHLRHSLNAVYRQTCESRQGFGRESPHIMGHIKEIDDDDDRMYGQHPAMMHQRPYGYAALGDTTNYMKRHSYAGERQQEGSYVPPYMRHGVSNWNVSSGIRGGGGYDSPVRNPFPGGSGYNDPRHPPQPRPDQMHRTANMRQSYHGNVKQFVSSQHNMPSFEQMSKTFMRDWRVTSYLNNSDAPIAESQEYLDQPYDMAPEQQHKPHMPHLHSRLRSSVVLTSVIPEHETEVVNGYTGCSSNSQQGREPYRNRMAPPSAHSRPLSPQQIKLNQPAEPLNYRAMHTDFALRRRSLVDDPKPSAGNGSSPRDYLNSYASLGRARGRMMSTREQDIHQLDQDHFKRHSVADPKSNMVAGYRETSNHMYAVLREREERNGGGREETGGGNNRGFPHNHNLSPDQRSVSHCDFNGERESRKPSAAAEPSSWRDSPSRTSSSTLLAMREKERAKPKSVLSSPQFFKKSSRKIKSLLNISDKKDASSSSSSPKTKSRSRHRSTEGSTETLVDEEELGGGEGQQGRESRGTASSSGRSSGSPRWRSRSTKTPSSVNRDIMNDDEDGRSSLPRFSTEGLDNSMAAECSSSVGRSSTGSQRSNTHSVRSGASRAPDMRPVLENGESRLNSRYEHRLPLRHSQQHHASSTTSSQASDRHRSSASSAKRDHVDRRANPPEQTANSHGYHDNKLGRLFQRVGNLINKKT